MISFIRGRLVHAGADSIIMDVGGIGYKIFVPTSVLGMVSNKNEEVIVYTYLHVREDAMQLFGFTEESDREIFELLLQVSGIGPKVALAILSSMPVSSFIQAVANEQLNTLIQTPGVGKKVAQRIIIELKDKITKMDVGENTSKGEICSPDEASSEALQALISLGYNPNEARKALKKILPRDTGPSTTEDLVKMALKELMRI